MIDVKQLWKIRATAYWNEAIRYFRLMANSGLLFALYFLIIVGGYYYQKLLDWLPESFQVEWVFIVIFLLLLTKTNIRTFMKEGDLVFFLPLEGRLAPYIRRSIIYSICLQSAVIVLVIMVLSPLFLHRIGDIKQLFFALFLIIIVKGWNVIAKWASQRYLQIQDRRANLYFIRLPINATFLFLLFFQANIVFLLVVFLIMGCLYLFYYRNIRKSHSLKWEDLLAIEERMLYSFYRFANLFTDVPKLKHRTKERTAFNWLLTFIRYDQKNIFSYLFLRSFLRANDYFGIYVRLIFVAMIFLYIIPLNVIHLLVYFAFLFITALQLSTLLHHYQFQLWIDLYPVDKKWKKKAISQLVFALLTLKALLLAVFLLVLTKNISLPLIYLASGVIFSYFCAYQWIYLKKKLAT